jgi:hypothetical protein
MLAHFGGELVGLAEGPVSTVVAKYAPPADAVKAHGQPCRHTGAPGLESGTGCRGKVQQPPALTTVCVLGHGSAPA